MSKTRTYLKYKQSETLPLQSLYDGIGLTIVYRSNQQTKHYTD